MADSTPTQDNRLIRLNVPQLNDRDKLLLESFSGQEGISFAFRYDLSLLSTDPAIPFETVIGKEATVTVCLPDDKKRYINGIISSFSQGGTSTTLTAYQAVLVPKLWLLTRVADSRIFQNLNVPDILSIILQKNAITPVDRQLRMERYEKREYCVQYSETDFHFIARLMEDEGIFYYFEHSENQHKLVLTDKVPSSTNHAVPFLPEAVFEGSRSKQIQEQAIYSWNMAQEIRPDKYTVRDYNFEKPRQDLTASSKSVSNPTREIYDYPERFDDPDDGQIVADLRMEEIETANTVVTGNGTCRAFVSGYLFKLTGHYRKDVTNRFYLLTTIFHSFKQGDDFCSTGKAVSDVFSYTNTFSCIPAGNTYRSPRTTQVPAIASVQTAIVVGANTTDNHGNPPPKPAPHTVQDQIYTDKFGRVKVRFHWDRSSLNGDTTCWLRTAHPWASTGWGHQWIPRIGQEVVVTFLEGDPDRPLITGAVYNGDNGLPFTTDHYKTQSGIRTRTNPIDPDAANDKYNMLRFDDKRNCEQVFLRSQKRLDVRALASYYDTSGGDRNTLIGGKDDQGHQGGDYTLTVGNDTDIHINGGLFQKVEKKLNATVVSDVVYDLEANRATLVKTKSELNAKQIIVEASEKISLKVGPSFVLIEPSGVTIYGPSVKINSGGYGVETGDPDIDDPLDAAPADTGRPGYVDCSKHAGGGGGRHRRTRRLHSQHAPSLPRPGEDPRMAAIRNTLQNSAAGRHALEVYDRYGINATFVSGTGGFYDGPPYTTHNNMVLDPAWGDYNDTAFVHEMNHAQAGREGTTDMPATDPNRAHYVDSRLQEEAHGDALANQAATELHDAGTPVTTPPPNQPAYQRGYNQGVNDYRAAHPDATPADLDAAGRQAGEQSVLNDYRAGRVTTSTAGGQPYNQFWGNAWDQAHPPAPAGGGHP